MTDTPPPYGTPRSSGPCSPKAVRAMERSYRQFLRLRRKRVLENIGLPESDRPFLREE